MKYRNEHDSLGEIEVNEENLWGAQTERSRRNFTIGSGHEMMPQEVVECLALIKKASASANAELAGTKMTEKKRNAINKACDEIISGVHTGQFPLVVWQTGSGTQTNMNVNEVIAHIGNAKSGETLLHPNDDVNMSQSSNDVFPSAMHIAAVKIIYEKLIPAVEDLVREFKRLEEENTDSVKCGRTHLQDALPVSFAQEISGWRFSLEKNIQFLRTATEPLFELALGGTAVGTGLNAPEGFDKRVCEIIADMTGYPFKSSANKFHALSSKGELVFAHGAVKTLATDLMKIANDIRWLASGPRLGLGEISIPANEPGSSIMPGKVNPTQCEAVTMVAVQIMGNDAAIGFAASQGNFELNVFMPVIIYNFMQSARLLAQVTESFTKNCVSGIKANKEKMKKNLNDSLMLATALNPVIGYEKAAETVKLAYNGNLTLKQACVQLGFLTEEKFDEVFHPEEMI